MEKKGCCTGTTVDWRLRAFIERGQNGVLAKPAAIGLRVDLS